ncbi:MAG: GNAT family N-acetyltransferase [Burkholderiales bacterium]
MALEISLATAKQLPALVELLGILFSQEREFMPDPARQRRGLERILANPSIGALFVAVDRTDRAARVIGMASLLYSESTFLGGPVGWLEDVVVHPQWRGQGVGTALIDHIKTFAREHGLLRITLLTDFDNARAIRRYENAGFVRSTMIPMRLVFNDGR